MTEPTATQAGTTQICELAGAIADRAQAIYDTRPPDPQWLRAQVAILVNSVTRLSQWVQPAVNPDMIRLNAAQQLLLRQYAEVDSGQRMVAGAGMRVRSRQQARAELIRQGLIADPPVGDQWLTDLGRLLAAGLARARRVVR